MTDSKAKSLVAYHEVGHAICATMTPGHDALQQVSSMAKQMVTNFGMSDIGPRSLQDPSAQSGDMIMRMMAKNSMSEQLLEDIDAAVKKITDDAYVTALGHIRDNREAIDAITAELLVTE